MDWLTLFLIAVGLAMDVFAVSLGIGTSAVARSPRSIFRLSFHFGLFQGGMTYLGWLLGSTIALLIASFDHWIALILLAWVGGRMIIAGLNHKPEAQSLEDPSRGGTLIMLAVATSLDAMAVGLSMAMLQLDIVAACLLIGFVSTSFSLIGLALGTGVGLRFGKRMEVLGGLILIGIGLRILITHLTGG